MVDDRRVRPYGMSEGEGAHYAPDGSEQMVLFKNNGTYITSLDGTSVQDSKTKQTRMVSLRHVNKKMQTHKIDKQQSSQSGGSSGGSSGASAQQLDASSGINMRVIVSTQKFALQLIRLSSMLLVISSLVFTTNLLSDGSWTSVELGPVLWKCLRIK
jgi:phage gp45-like